MPTKGINEVLAAPFIAPIYRGNLSQWTQDLARELELRLKEYGNAINSQIGFDQDARMSFFLGSDTGRDTEMARTELSARLELMLPGPGRKDDEAIRRQFLGV